MASLEEIIKNIAKNPKDYPEANRTARQRRHRMNRQLNKTFKGKGPLARIPATEDETYPVTDESENFSIPDEPFNESEFVESLVGSGVERNEAEKLASYYLGNKKPEDDTDKKYSEIFDMLSQRYKKLQESGQVGE